MSVRSPFEILGISETATDEEIKAAYRALVKRWHPDRNPDNPHAAEVFKAIVEAYEQIRSPEGRMAWRRSRGAEWGHGASWRPDADWVRRRPSSYDEAFDDFHGQEVEIRSGTRVTLDLTLEEAVCGVRRHVHLPHGTVEVDVPEGVEDGEEIVLRGAVPASARGRSASDLRVSVRVRPDPVWKREGLDLLRGFEVDPAVAVVGGERRVSLLGGRMVWVKVPPGTQPGTWIRLPKLGVRRGPRQGDVRLEMRIRIPTVLSREARRLWEELERLGRER